MSEPLTPPTDDELEVSVVLPCLNEEVTLAASIRAAREALEGAGIRGEVVVADNGSRDRSPQIAVEEGARLVRVAARGYGNALFHGMSAARGRYLVFLDADLSYEFAHIPRFVAELRRGADLVMGSRFKGTIDPQAMPWLHRRLGTPVLTRIANVFYGCRISDIMCGMRGLTKEAFARLGLRAGGMEFASEIPIKAALLNMKIAEIPTDLHPDGRDRPPHLRSFRDGWRHLRFMLLFCPTWLFFIPGLALATGGIALIVAILLGISPYMGLITCLIGMATTVAGVQTMLLGIATRGFEQLRRLRVRDTALDRFMEKLTLEKGILAGSLVAAGGALILAIAVVQTISFMSDPGYNLGLLDLTSTKLALFGTTLLVVGTEIVFASFFLGLFNIEPLSDQEPAPAATSLRLNVRGVPDPTGDVEGR